VQKINIFGFFIVDGLSKGRESGALSRFSGMRLFQRNDDKSVLTASKPGSDHRQGRFVGQWYAIQVAMSIIFFGSSAESVGETDLLRHRELTFRTESLRAGRVRVSE
jgi:hypothetical protein